MAIKVINGYNVILDDNIINFINSMGYWQVLTPTAKKHGLYYFYHDYRKSHNAKHKLIYLHSFICGAMKGDVVDHINGNTLDNRICNLRIVSPRINAQNCKPHKKKSKLPPGVRLREQTNRYQARITKDGKTYSLGCFNTIEEARESYKKAEYILYRDIRDGLYDWPKTSA